MRRCPRISAGLAIAGLVASLAAPVTGEVLRPQPDPGVPAAVGSSSATSEISAAPMTYAPKVMPDFRPPARDGNLPRTRWEHRREGKLWTRAALSALKDHGAPLVETVPRDIAAWCPAYADNPPEKRRQFWVGLLSALAKHESTYRPEAVGGGGLWYGLLQILPATARGYRCAVGSGAALKNGSANLSCAIRIMARTVPRDQVIAVHNGRWRGIAADWGPMTSSSKRAEMAAWLRRQTYCSPLDSVRPRVRPASLEVMAATPRLDGAPYLTTSNMVRALHP